MATKYILDLTKEEYRDDFMGIAEFDKNQPKEFWQYEARDKLVEKLELFLSDAQKYKGERAKNRSKTWLSHNAILVTGQRGTGKTVFLRNSEVMWQSFCKLSSNPSSAIYFLDSIDPTMLVEQDNFANVIIAQIYSEVEFKIKKNSSDVSELLKSDFYKTLKILADSLGKKEEFEGYSGIDKVLQYKSGINIEKYFHNYVESAINILGCDALALPIDDVDMALNRAYEVVDEVRRLLGCPYIIPIVSGDVRLYEQMVNIHFDEKAYRSRSQNQLCINKGINLSTELTDAYLTKVFPNQMRITLLPIDYIAPTLEIKTSAKSEMYPYRDHVRQVHSQFYPLCLNEEVLEGWPKPESAREFTQFVRSIPPHKLDLAKEDKDIAYKLWKNYINWAEQKQNGLAYTNVNSYLSLKNRDEEDLFNIMNLTSFNPKLQIKAEHVPWADKEFLNSQLLSLGLQSQEQLDELKRGRGDGWKRDNADLLEFAFSKQDKTLTSMPPLEFFHKKSMVTIDRKRDALLLSNENIVSHLDTSIECSLGGLLIDIFTHGDVYSKLANRYNYVCMSRAFEIIAYSFLMGENEKSIYNTLLNIFRRRPFYSVFNMSPTKSIDGNEHDKVEAVEVNEQSNKPHYASIIEARIVKWRQKHKALFDSFQSEEFIPILFYIFNKSFTAFHTFRFESFIKSSFTTDEHLTDHIKRFEFMLINSAYTAMIDGPAIQANVAITSNQTTIRNPKEFMRYDRTLTRNKQRFDEQVRQDQDQAKLLFIDALEKHPIFTLIKNDSSNDSLVKVLVPLGESDKNAEASLSSKLTEHQKNILSKYYEENSHIYKDKTAKLNIVREYLEQDIKEDSYRAENFYTSEVSVFPNKNEVKKSGGSNAELNLFKALYDKFEIEK